MSLHYLRKFKNTKQHDSGRPLPALRSIKPVVRNLRRKSSSVCRFQFLLGYFLNSLLAENLLHSHGFLIKILSLKLNIRLIISASLAIRIAIKLSEAVLLWNIRHPHLSAHVHCGKMADWIWMPFGVVSGVGLGMGVLDFSGDRRRETKGEVWGVNLWRPIITNGDFVASLCGSA